MQAGDLKSLHKLCTHRISYMINNVDHNLSFSLQLLPIALSIDPTCSRGMVGKLRTKDLVSLRMQPVQVTFLIVP